MLLNGKAIDEVTEGELQALVSDQQAEILTLEFKKSLPGQSYDHKKEFLADVSSFANTAGGFIIYGITENHGTAAVLSGCIGVADDELLRLSNSLLDGIDPRIRGLTHRVISLTNGNWVLILSISKSWIGPHVVTFQGSSRVFGRQFSGKYQLKPDQIKEAYTLSGTLQMKLQNYRPDRVAKIESGETPIPLWDEPKIVIHIVPISTMNDMNAFDIKSVEHSALWHKVFFEGDSNNRPNLDGLLKSYVSRIAEYGESGIAYIQLFRNGIIEAVDAFTLRLNRIDGQIIPYVTLEEHVISLCYRALLLLQYIDIQPPVMIYLSMLGVAGFKMATNHLPRQFRNSEAIDRHMLLLPVVELNEYPQNASALITCLKPPMDTLWNATGFPEWITYPSCLQTLGSMKP